MLTAAVNHDGWMASRYCLRDHVRCLLDMLRGEVRAARAATKDNVNVLISTRFDNSGNSVLCDTHERMRVDA
jgi:hypothetical protein